MKWICVADKEPDRAGWYAAAKNPLDYDKNNASDSNHWRELYGFTKAWFNPMAVKKWWEADPHGNRMTPIDEDITHWGILPKVPLY
jgi:hypothetical protein